VASNPDMATADRREVIVIGAGPGGLACAMLLAKAGLNVRVLERQGCVGGRTATVERDGFRFDLGPTFFLYPAILAEIFDACGGSLWDAVAMVPLDPAYHLLFEQGGSIHATADRARMRRELARLNEHDAAHFESYLQDNRGKFGSFRSILQRPFLSWRDLLARDTLASLKYLRPWASVDDDLKRHFEDPRIRLAFSFQSKYLGMSPFQCPSLFTILAFLEYEYGVYHPIGGCGAVSQAMADHARSLGADIHLSEPVEEVLTDGDRATGVRTAKGTYRADAIVMNADFAHAMEQLVPDGKRRRWTNGKLSRKRYSCSTFMMYLGIDGWYDDLAHHSIYLTKDYEANLADIEKRHVIPDNPSFYVQNACVTDSTLAPPGMSTLYCLAPMSHEHPNIDWAKEKGAFRAKFYDQLERKLGLSDLRRRVRSETILSPRDWRDELAIYRGATFNLAHNLGQMLHLRPRNRFEDLKGMYLVGGGTHPGSGLPVIYESARITARLLLAEFDRPMPEASIDGEAASQRAASLEPSV